MKPPRVFQLTQLGCLAFLLFAFHSLPASQGEGMEAIEQEECRGILLPGWEEGASRESFDVRIWPSATILWLERENLRDLIEDPDTPEEERRALQKILALQIALRREPRRS